MSLQLVSFLMPKIRLISDIAPGSTHTAGIILEQIIKFSGSNYDWELNIIVDDSLLDYSVSPYLHKKSISWIKKPKEHHPKSRIMQKCVVPLVESLASKKINLFIQYIKRMESRNRSDLILIAIQGQSSYRIAQALLEENLPVSLIFWDPWEWWELEKNVPLRFRKVVKNVHLLASKNGAHLFPTKDFAIDLGFNSKSTVVLYPHVSKFAYSHSLRSKKGAKKEIVFLGQAYAINEINALYNHLKSESFTFQDSSIILHSYGRSSPFPAPNVIHHGWIDYGNLAKIISKYDFALLPYPAIKKMKKVSLLSFPSKLAQYLTAGLDIIYVGPKISSIVKFFEANNIKGNTYQIKPETDASEEIYLILYEFANPEESQRLYERYFGEAAFASTITLWLNAYGLPKPECVNRLEIKVHGNYLIRSFPRIVNKYDILFGIFKKSQIKRTLYHIHKFTFQILKSRRHLCSILKFLLTYLRNRIK
jgi:hypothetical protein